MVISRAVIIKTLNLFKTIGGLEDYLRKMSEEDKDRLFSSKIFLSYRLSYHIVQKISGKHSRVLSVGIERREDKRIFIVIKRELERPYELEIVKEKEDV